jgi:hypothetical protein
MKKSMITLFDCWKKGWIVFARLLFFLIVVQVCAIPLSLLKLITDEDTVFENGIFHPWVLLIIILILVISPFLMFAASRITGEFIAPRKKE